MLNLMINNCFDRSGITTCKPFCNLQIAEGFVFLCDPTNL